MRRGTVNSRILGKFAAAISSEELHIWDNDHSMFDWPEQSHTSPTKTLVNFIVVLAATEDIVNSAGSLEALIGSS